MFASSTNTDTLDDKVPYYGDFGRKLHEGDDRDWQHWLQVDGDSKWQVGSSSSESVKDGMNREVGTKRQGNGCVAAENESGPSSSPDYEDSGKVEESVIEEPLTLNQGEGLNVPEVIPAESNLIQNFNENVCLSNEVGRKFRNEDYRRTGVCGKVNSQSLPSKGQPPNDEKTQEVTSKSSKSCTITKEGTDRNATESPLPSFAHHSSNFSPENSYSSLQPDAVAQKFVSSGQIGTEQPQTFNHGVEALPFHQLTPLSQSQFEDYDYLNFHHEQCSKHKESEQVVPEFQQLTERKRHATTSTSEEENTLPSEDKKIKQHTWEMTDNKEEEGMFVSNVTPTESSTHNIPVFTCSSWDCFDYCDNRPDQTELYDEWMEETPPPSPPTTVFDCSSQVLCGNHNNSTWSDLTELGIDILFPILDQPCKSECIGFLMEQ